MGIILEKVRVTPPTLKEALTSSIRMERYLAELHVGGVVKFTDDSLKGLFNAMMNADQYHISSLQAALDKLNDAEEWTFTN